MPASVTGTGTAAHEAAMTTPMDRRLAAVVMRASNRADEASHVAGVKPSSDWLPGKRD